MLGFKMVRNPEIDEPWLRKAGEVPAALSFKEALRVFVLHIVQLFHLQIETNAMQEKPKIRWVCFVWRLILKVLHVWVTAEHLANRDFEQDVRGSLRVTLRREVLHELAKTEGVELIEDIVKGLNAIRVFNNTGLPIFSLSKKYILHFN